jgi:prevent-host-death family protein
MLNFDAKEAKQSFGRLLDSARRAPVTIRKHGRKVAVMLSHEEFEALEALSDAYWAKRAKAAEKQGFLSVTETRKFLEGLGNDKKRTARPPRRKSSGKASAKTRAANQRKDRNA